MKGIWVMPSIHDQLRQSLPHTAYQIAQMIAAETDPGNAEFRRTQKRWERWLKGGSLTTIENMQKDLKSLGLELKLQPVSEEES